MSVANRSSSHGLRAVHGLSWGGRLILSPRLEIQGYVNQRAVGAVLLNDACSPYYYTYSSIPTVNVYMYIGMFSVGIII